MLCSLLEPTNNSDPYLESLTCRFGVILHRTQRLGQLIPDTLLAAFKIDERGPQATGALLLALLPQSTPRRFL
jgi:hypothetical protein